MSPGPRSQVPGPRFTATDHLMMARALRLAARGVATTQPNPRVGCVIAHGSEIIAEGWHQRAGAPHAETLALALAGTRVHGATAYVTLEPCSHHGRTPPCADALIEAGIARVVAAAADPNPKIAGAGLARLRERGVAVETGLVRDAARELNRGFFSRFERGRPWVRVKLAMSLDGRTALASGASKWITCESARTDVQRWRARSSAILTGAGTARADDPRLTVRLAGTQPRSAAPVESAPPVEGTGILAMTAGSDAPAGTAREALPFAGQHAGQTADADAVAERGFRPLRVVLDTRLDALAPNAQLLDGRTPTLILHAPGASPRDGRYARAELAEAPVVADGTRIALDAVLRLLATRGVNELQVEAGPTLCGALFDAGLVDELLLYVAPTFLGDAARALLALPVLQTMAETRAWRVVDRRQIGRDARLLLRPADMGS